jgi:pimeloyl-ACP methyl ester carboxylesterase
MGLEDLVMHRPIRRLACSLAEAGMPALRFDYRCTGDSLGAEADPDQVHAWLSDVRRAVQWLRDETGVTEVALIGFRLGALLAAQVAAQLGDVAALVLVGPVMSGKSYLHEATALQAFVAQSTGARDPVSQDPDDGNRGLNVAGFNLTAATVGDLECLDLHSLKRRPASRVLLLGRTNSPADRRLGELLRSLGADVTVGILPGFAAMQWNSSLASLPDDAFAELVRWLGRDPPAGHASCIRFGSPTLQSARWREEPLIFGSDARLFAMHCSSLDSSPGAAVLMVNHGLNHHIGWARMSVVLARRLAAQGVGSLRLDIAGLGDSDASSRRPEHQLYASEAVTDVQEALAWLRRLGYEQITIIGHSSGAHLGFHAAAVDERVTGLVMINLQRFIHVADEPAEVAKRSQFRSTRWYFSMLGDLGCWRRLACLKIDILGIARVLSSRFLRRACTSLILRFGTTTGTAARQALVLDLFRLLSRRGTKVLLVYSAEDGGLDELALYGGRGGRRITKLPHIDLQIINNVDHNLTPRWAQELYFTLLENHIGLRREPRWRREEMPIQHEYPLISTDITSR